MQIDFKKYNADGIGSRPATLPRVDFAMFNQPWADKSTTPLVLVHVHRFPNKQNHTRNPPKRKQLSTHNLPKRHQPSMRTPPKRNRVGAVPVCPPVSPCEGASIVHSPRTKRVFLYGNAAVRTFGRAHRRRPYGFVWVDCAWVVDVVWAGCAWNG